MTTTKQAFSTVLRLEKKKATLQQKIIGLKEIMTDMIALIKDAKKKAAQLKMMEKANK